MVFQLTLSRVTALEQASGELPSGHCDSMLKNLEEQAKNFGLHPQGKQKPSDLRNKAMGSSDLPLRNMFVSSDRTETRLEVGDFENPPTLWRLSWSQ